MKLQTGATQVALRTSQMLQAGHGRTGAPILEPSWYRVVLQTPPTHQLYRRVRRLRAGSKEPKVGEETRDGFFVTRNRQKHRVDAKHLYRLPELRFIEDRIRTQFYNNHPWELARPRSVIERPRPESFDWSTMDQKNCRLTGESCVQRALWLARQPEYIKEHGKDWYDAYTQARLEFYRLRLREFAEQQVAAEEAVMNGAVFGPSTIEYQVQHEQNIIENFESEAIELTKERRSRQQQIIASD